MTSPISNDSFLQWDAAQVSTYINSILPNDQRRIGDVFLDNNIDGSLLPFITTEHLKEIGIISLQTRLVIKKGISDLISVHYLKNPPRSLNDPEYKFNHININSNYMSVETLNFSTVLMQDMMRKFNFDLEEQRSIIAASSPISPTHDDMKKLNDNFIKLKTDLIPIIRLLKDSKPLPTPTLDPGPAASLDSPSYFSSHHTFDHDSSDKGLSRSASGNHDHYNGNTNTNGNTSRSSTTMPSPASNRFSSGSLLSMGTGKIVSQSVPKYSENKMANEFKLQKVGLPRSSSNKSLEMHDRQQPSASTLRPRLIDNKSSPSMHTVGSPIGIPPSASTSIANGHTGGGGYAPQVSTPPHQQPPPQHQQPSQQPPPQSHSYHQNTGSEPLKQLRASTDDSCLKILQQAMKRHHIPRDDWSRYVLVICYGDKERILKLAEKPVVIFKELQELGKHPAIMLRQLADNTNSDTDSESAIYDDARIGTEIPGGTL
ncbi:Protein STE50 [Candida viswanathii]|uniref:Protein STE50 n=1 Tax=Candida viswanathii TaxID=5486 RepID=A0A367XW54_9ASCO|nr:Protein STE50 [Candida viswanathii]